MVIKVCIASRPDPKTGEQQYHIIVGELEAPLSILPLTVKKNFYGLFWDYNNSYRKFCKHFFITALRAPQNLEMLLQKKVKNRLLQTLKFLNQFHGTVLRKVLGSLQNNNGANIISPPAQRDDPYGESIETNMWYLARLQLISLNWHLCESILEAKNTEYIHAEEMTSETQMNNKDMETWSADPKNDESNDTSTKETDDDFDDYM